MRAPNSKISRFCATTLALQGDLKGALRKLEKEIKTRERGLKTAKKK
jgi:hypothetical protein